MRIYECADYRAMSRRAASLIAAQVVLKPRDSGTLFVIFICAP